MVLVNAFRLRQSSLKDGQSLLGGSTNTQKADTTDTGRLKVYQAISAGSDDPNGAARGLWFTLGLPVS